MPTDGSFARGAACALALLVWTTAAWADDADGPKKISFRFAPPDGTELVQTLRTTRENELEGLGRQADQHAAETEITYRHSEDGTVMTSKLLSIETTRNGKQVKDPVSELLKATVITYRIDGDGQVEEITGFGSLVTMVEEAFPPEVAKVLAPMLDEQAVVAREKAEWNSTVGDFAGADVAIGDVLETEVPFTLPDGESLVYFARTSFPRMEACPAGSCVRVEVLYDSDAAALDRLATRAAAGIAAAASDEAVAVSPSGIRLSGSTTRLIDPSTMLIYEETRERTTKMSVEVPGRGSIPSTMKETRRYTFSYR